MLVSIICLLFIRFVFVNQQWVDHRILDWGDYTIFDWNEDLLFYWHQNLLDNRFVLAYDGVLYNSNLSKEFLHPRLVPIFADDEGAY